MIEGIQGSGVNYDDRLKELGLTTLETRRHWEQISLRSFRLLRVVIDEEGRRGHSQKLFNIRVRLEVCKYMFSNRICELWNAHQKKWLGLRVLMNLGWDVHISHKH